MKLKLTTAILIAISSVSLIACQPNNGDDNDNTRSGNHSYYIQPIKLNIVNMEAISFNKITISDNQNKEILNHGFSCASGATCPLDFKERLQTPITLKFYNQNKLITTYTIVDLANNFGKIKTNDVMLGTYIYKQLKAQDKKLAETLSNKLNTFFDCYCSPDKSPDNFEELGLYYKAMVVHGKQTDDQFYKKLIADLNAGKKLPGGSFSKNKQQLTQLKTLTVNSTQAPLKSANGSSCSQYTSGIMTAFSALKLFPLPGVTVFDFADRIVTGACDSFQGDVLNGLDEIKKNLDQLNAKINAIQYNIQELADKIDRQNLGQNLTDINNKIEEWSVLRDSYYQILNGGNYKNFSEFLRSNGNIAGVMQKGGSAKVLLTTQLKNFNSFYAQINESTRLDSIRNSLLSLCGTAENIHEDIIKRRLECNLITTDLIAKLTSTAQEEKIILSDISNAIMKDPGYHDILKDSSILPPVGTPWEKVDATVSQQQIDKLKVIQSKFASNGIPFIPYQGLPEELQKNIAAVGCDYNNTAPNINYWKVSADKTKPWETYIGVTCQDNGKKYGKELNSVYGYMVEKDNNVRNVLGVLVSDTYVNKALDRTIMDNDNRYYELIETKDDHFEMGIFLTGARANGQLLSFNSDTYNNFNNRIINSSLDNNPLRWLPDKGMLFSYVVFPEREYPKSVSNDYIIPMSYIDNGATYVFALKIRAITTSNATSPRQIETGLLCLSSNCQQSGSRKEKYSKLTFNTGTSAPLNIQFDDGGKNTIGKQFLRIW